MKDYLLYVIIAVLLITAWFTPQRELGHKGMQYEKVD